MLFTEDNRLKFNDSEAIRAIQFDDNTHKADSWKKVDFEVEWENELWLIEVKDPTDEYTERYHPKTGELKEEKFVCQHLFEKDLGPKGRDSFLYLHLLGRIPKDKKIRYLVLIANCCNGDGALDWARSELNRVMAIKATSWKSIYIDSVAVLNLNTWNQYFPQFPVSRISTG